MAVLHWLGNHWWWFFWLWALGFFEGVRNWFAGLFESVMALGDRRHERPLELERAKAAAAPPVPQVSREIPLPPRPGRCAHRRVTPVVAADESVVAWLCKGCDTQLPPDWAVRAEDL